MAELLIDMLSPCSKVQGSERHIKVSQYASTEQENFPQNFRNQNEAQSLTRLSVC